MNCAPVAPIEAIAPSSPSALPLELLVGWAAMTSDVRSNSGEIGTEKVRARAQPPENGADCETSKFKTSPMAVPVTVIGCGKFTVTLGVPGPLSEPSSKISPEDGFQASAHGRRAIVGRGSRGVNALRNARRCEWFEIAVQVDKFNAQRRGEQRHGLPRLARERQALQRYRKLNQLIVRGARRQEDDSSVSAENGPRPATPTTRGEQNSKRESQRRHKAEKAGIRAIKECAELGVHDLSLDGPSYE